MRVASSRKAEIHSTYTDQRDENCTWICSLSGIVSTNLKRELIAAKLSTHKMSCKGHLWSSFDRVVARHLTVSCSIFELLSLVNDLEASSTTCN